MAKEKEDNRDIFDKALEDYAPLVGGAIAGGMVGRGLGKLASKRMKREHDFNQGQGQRASDDAEYWQQARDRDTRSFGGHDTHYQNRTREMEAADRSQAEYYFERAKKVASGMTNAKNLGMVAGAGAGAATASSVTHPSKRRK